jgi:hypothetical protein
MRGPGAHRGEARIRFGSTVYADAELTAPWAMVVSAAPFEVIWYEDRPAAELLRIPGTHSCDRPPAFVARERLEQATEDGER